MSEVNAMRIVNEHLRRERSSRVASLPQWDDFYGTWMISAGASAISWEVGDPMFVVTADGSAHALDNESYAGHHLMHKLGIPPLNDTIDAWEREGGAEGMARLAERRYAEAQEQLPAEVQDAVFGRVAEAILGDAGNTSGIDDRADK